MNQIRNPLDDKIIRYPVLKPIPIEAVCYEGCSAVLNACDVVTEEIHFTRQKYLNPFELDGKGKPVTWTVKGVRGAQAVGNPEHLHESRHHVPYGWIIPMWRCSKCKVNFIIGDDIKALRHECTNPSNSEELHK